MRVAVVILSAAGAFVLPSHAQQTPAPVPVGVVKVERKPVSASLDFVGRAEAVNRVEIKARVTGFLEGVPIKQGGPLYRIEKGLFETAVQQAEGALERSKASKELSAVQLQRAQDLMDKNAGTVVARDQAKAADDQAAGQITTDEANLETAKINLGYTGVVSPITGKASKTNI